MFLNYYFMNISVGKLLFADTFCSYLKTASSYCDNMVARFSVTYYLIVSIMSPWRKIWFSLRVSRTHTPVPSLVTEPFSSLPGCSEKIFSRPRSSERDETWIYVFRRERGCARISLFHRRNRWRVDPKKNVSRCQEPVKESSKPP